MTHLSTSGGQHNGASASVSVLNRESHLPKDTWTVADLGFQFRPGSSLMLKHLTLTPAPCQSGGTGKGQAPGGFSLRFLEL